MLRGTSVFASSILFLVAITVTINSKTCYGLSNDSIPPGSESPDSQPYGDWADQYLTKAIKVRVIKLCNDDGSDPGNPSLSYINQGIAEANTVLNDNSGANVLYYLDPETNLSECIHNSLANYDCYLNPDYFPGKKQEEITAADLQSLTEADLNQDGEVDSYDTEQLCDTSKQGNIRKNIAYDYVGSLVVFIRGLEARRRVKYDEDLGHWVFSYPSGGYSSCAGNFVVMNSGYWGNLLAHEAGHYLCTPHTFSRSPADKQGAEDQIAAVIDKYGLNPADKENVLNYTYDADRGTVDFLGDHQILDTPPDPNSTLWKSEFGDDLCLPENDEISIEVSAHNTTYDLHPDRFLVMSYFKGCTGLVQRFSPHQVERIELSLSHHRKHLVNKEVVECYNNKYNGTNWNGMEHEQAFELKDYYLNQCQSGPNFGSINDKTYYPKPKPLPIWSDPVKRIFLQDMELREIQDEIDMDISLQEVRRGVNSGLVPIVSVDPMISASWIFSKSMLIRDHGK